MSILNDIKVSVQTLDSSVRTVDATDPEDCGLGHACQFCPKEVNCKLDKNAHHKLLMQNRLAGIEQIIMVVANKGGVGKSTVAANLAALLASKGHRVGVADADIHGPNQSRFFGHVGSHVRVNSNGLDICEFTHEVCEHPVSVASLAFLSQSDDTPIVWRDAYKHDFIHHLMGSFSWPELDYLVVDMPPGTGNELITLCDLLEGSEVVSVLVTTPQSVALMDSMKMATFARERGMPVIGVVENMAGVVCPHCGEDFHLFPRTELDAALTSAHLTTIAQLPLSAEIALASDNGVPAVLDPAATNLRKAMNPLVLACESHVDSRRKEINAGALGAVLQLNMESDELRNALNALDKDSRKRAEQQLAQLTAAEATRAGDQTTAAVPTVADATGD